MSDEPAKKEPREVSPEEYRQMVSSGNTHAAKYAAPPPYFKTFLPLIVIVGCLLLGFVGGMEYQKGKTTNTSSTAAGRNGAAGGYGQFGGRGARRGGFGQVTAVSNNSITVQNSRTGAAQTYNITSSTTVTNNGASASVGDIKTGDTVIVRTDPTDTSTATTIAINPSFGGGAGAPEPSSQGTSDDTSGGSSADGSSTI